MSIGCGLRQPRRNILYIDFFRRENTFMKYLFALSIKSIKFVAENRRNIFVVQLFLTQTLFVLKFHVS